MITLTQHERDKFAAWLEQEAHSNDALATQLVSSMANVMADAMARRYRTIAMGCRIVALDLRSIEEQTIGGEP